MPFNESTIQKKLKVDNFDQPEKNKFEKTKSLFIQQAELFDLLEENQNNLDRQDLLNLTYRLFEHSIDDGLKIAERLHLTPDEILSCLQRQQFFIKHSKFIHYLKDELQRKKSKANLENKQEIENLIEKYSDFEQKTKKG
ncbi:MAG: hypothetical protein ABIF17_02510, partial [Patescibacteria group bacterium]